MTETVQDLFQRSVEEGERRLHRSWPGLMATGAVGGIDIGLGVLALLIVQHATGNALLGALAFAIGFVALALARSELFTENFLVPIAATAAHRGSIWELLRLWAGTLVMNLAGGWIVMALIVAGSPELRSTSGEVASHFVEIGFAGRALALAIVAGVLITLMTWMEHGTRSDMARIAAAVGAAFVLAAGHLNHAVVMSLEMFAALQFGADFGYADWLKALGIAIVGNLIGGIGLVTVLRLVQVGAGKVHEERERASSDGQGPNADAQSREWDDAGRATSAGRACDGSGTVARLPGHLRGGRN